MVAIIQRCVHAQARLLSVLDQLRNVLGDAASEAEMRAATLSQDFHMERALDTLLNKQASAPQPVTATQATGVFLMLLLIVCHLCLILNIDPIGCIANRSARHT